MKVAILFISFFLVNFGEVIQAQNAIPATGGNGSGSGGSISYTVGQVVYNAISGSNGSVIQGIQQPYEISVVTGIENKEINLGFLVYPNPATEFLVLKVDGFENMNLSCWLYDIGGTLVLNKKVTTGETQINVQSLSAGTYFLKVTSGSKELKVFKVIKN
jgi:hypothetical protein